MEMHQIRYFLGVTRTLNFTRAAEECYVSQPSLTRAIKLLEDELGGDLFRRERNHSHLTDLGQRMLPLMQQCYDTAQGVKLLATSIKRGDVATLRLALSRTIDLRLVIPLLSELTRAMNGLELKFLRGTSDEVVELMKQGDADLALTGPLSVIWDRFETWPLFEEPYVLLAHNGHRLAGKPLADLEELRMERVLVRTYCEQAAQLASVLRSHGVSAAHAHEVASERDLLSLLEANIGVALAPRSTSGTANVEQMTVNALQLTRTVYVHAVAGRPRSAPAATLLRQLRASGWDHAVPPPQPQTARA